MGIINLLDTFQYVDTIKFNHKGIEVQNHCANMNSTKFISAKG
jgi:hypothetical protein